MNAQVVGGQVMAPGSRLSVGDIRSRRGQWTEAQLRALPVIVDVETAASILDMGLTKARAMVRAGTWPTRVIHNGDRWLVPVRPLLELLGIEPAAA